MTLTSDYNLQIFSINMKYFPHRYLQIFVVKLICAILFSMYVF